MPVPNLSIPQPAAGLPSQMPNQPSQNPFAGIAPLGKEGAALSPQPQATPAPQQDQSNPFANIKPMSEEQSSSEAKPSLDLGNFSGSGAAGARGAMAFQKAGGAPNIPTDVAGSVTDLAKTGLADNIQDQKEILNKLYPGKADIQNGRLVLKDEKGKSQQYDGFSLNIVKDLAQLSGKAIDFITQALITPLMTTAGASAGTAVAPGPGTAYGATSGYVASLPVGTWLGKTGKDYLMQSWTGVKPDEARAKADLKASIALNTIFGIAIPAAFSGGRFVNEQLANTAGNRAIANDAIQKGTRDLVESATGKTIYPPGLTSPSGEAGETVRKTYQSEMEKYSQRVGEVKARAISDSNDANVNISDLKQKYKDVLNEVAPGAIKYDQHGFIQSPNKPVPVYATPINPNPELTSPNDIAVSSIAPSKMEAPFGSAREGQKALSTLVDHYNALNAADVQSGGIPFSQFDRKVQELQGLSVSDQALFTDPKVNRVFSQLQHSASEQRNMEIINRIKDPVLKSKALDAYHDFATFKNPADQLDALWNQTHGVADSFADALVNPSNAKTLQGLKNMTAHNPQIMKDVKAAYLNRIFNENFNDATGQFNSRGFMKSIDSLGDSKQILFNQGEYNSMRYYSRQFERIKQADPSELGITQKIGRMILQLNPLTQESMSQTNAVQAMGAIKALESNPALAQKIASEGLDTNMGDINVLDKAQLSAWTRALISRLATQRGAASVTSTAVKENVKARMGLR